MAGAVGTAGAAGAAACLWRRGRGSGQHKLVSHVATDWLRLNAREAATKPAGASRQATVGGQPHPASGAGGIGGSGIGGSGIGGSGVGVEASAFPAYVSGMVRLQRVG